MTESAELKIIVVGDSAVGKSKLMERFLLNDFIPHQLSTYALTLYRHTALHPLSTPAEPRNITVDFWDTAGQEHFQNVHPSYYMGAHCCILVFDVTRKITYKNLEEWHKELCIYRGLQIPIIITANKMDMDPSRSRKTFAFVEKRRQERGGDPDSVPLFFVSASDGSNVVALFKEAIKRAWNFKETISSGGGEFVDEVLQFLDEEDKREDGGLFSKKISAALQDNEKDEAVPDDA